MIVFDGREYASEKEEDLKLKVDNLLERDITPKLVSIIVGNDPASVLYVNLKKKAAERIGAELEVIHLEDNIEKQGLIAEVEKYNDDDSINGIMVQLPLPDQLKQDTQEILQSINPTKDVDGLRKNSLFVHPTAMAVMEILDHAIDKTGTIPQRVAVVGASGMVGSAVTPLLKEMDFEVLECDHSTERLRDCLQKADVVVSATGEAGIIKGEMLKENVIVIDVGAPKGDVDFESTKEKASFITPVPGGVGPVTITCLLENLIKSIFIIVETF